MFKKLFGKKDSEPIKVENTPLEDTHQSEENIVEPLENTEELITHENVSEFEGEPVENSSKEDNEETQEESVFELGNNGSFANFDLSSYNDGDIEEHNETDLEEPIDSLEEVQFDLNEEEDSLADIDDMLDSINEEVNDDLDVVPADESRFIQGLNEADVRVNTPVEDENEQDEEDTHDELDMMLDSLHEEVTEGENDINDSTESSVDEDIDNSEEDQIIPIEELSEDAKIDNILFVIDNTLEDHKEHDDPHDDELFEVLGEETNEEVFVPKNPAPTHAAPKFFEKEDSSEDSADLEDDKEESVESDISDMIDEVSPVEESTDPVNNSVEYLNNTDEELIGLLGQEDDNLDNDVEELHSEDNAIVENKIPDDIEFGNEYGFNVKTFRGDHDTVRNSIKDYVKNYPVYVYDYTEHEDSFKYIDVDVNQVYAQKSPIYDSEIDELSFIIYTGLDYSADKMVELFSDMPAGLEQLADMIKRHVMASDRDNIHIIIAGEESPSEGYKLLEQKVIKNLDK